MRTANIESEPKLGVQPGAVFSEEIEALANTAWVTGEDFAPEIFARFGEKGIVPYLQELNRIRTDTVNEIENKANEAVAITTTETVKNTHEKEKTGRTTKLGLKIAAGALSLFAAVGGLVASRNAESAAEAGRSAIGYEFDQDSLEGVEAADNNAVLESADGKAQMAVMNWLRQQGWNEDEVHFGETNLIENPVERGRGSFSNSAEVGFVEFINSGTPAAIAAREDALKNLPPEEHSRYLSGEGRVRVQLLRDANIIGNAGFFDGTLEIINSPRFKPAGDVVEMYVGKDDYKVYVEVSTLTDCENPHVSTVVKAPDEKEQPTTTTTTKPGVTTTTKPPTTTTTSTTTTTAPPPKNDDGELPGPYPAPGVPDTRGEDPGEFCENCDQETGQIPGDPTNPEAPATTAPPAPPETQPPSDDGEPAPPTTPAPPVKPTVPPTSTPPATQPARPGATNSDAVSNQTSEATGGAQ